MSFKRSHFVPMSFSRLLFLWLLCTILPFVGFSAWYAYQQAYRATESYAMQFADQVAEQVQLETNRFLKQPIGQLQAVLALGQADLLELNTPNQLVKQLAVLQQQAPYLTFLSFGYADGQYVSSARPPLADSELEGIFSLEKDDMHLTFVHIDHQLNLQTQAEHRTSAHYDSRSRFWFQQALEKGQPSWYPVGRYQAYDSLGMGISSPVHDSQGRLLGVATADVALNQLNDFLHSTAENKHGLYFIAEHDGSLLAVSDASPTYVVPEEGFQRVHAMEAPNAVFPYMWQQHQNLRSGQMMATIGDTKFVINLQQLALEDGPKLLIAIAHPTNIFTAPLSSLATTLATAFLFIMLLCALVMFLVARRVTKPLGALSRWAEQLAQQDWQAPPPPPSGIKELQIVNEDLQQMAQQLASTTAQLAQKVEHRTEELNRTLMLLQHILRSAAGLSIIVTNPDGKIVLFNKGAELLSGFSVAEAMAKDSIVFLHAEPPTFAPDANHFSEFIAAHYQEGSGPKLTHYQHKIMGSVAVSLLTTPILDKAEQLSGYLFIAQDMTEQQRLSQMKDDFVSTVSHELRTPLTSINASLKLLNGGALGQLTDKQLQLTSIAEQNGQRLQSLINDLLDMDKLLAGQMELELCPYSLSDLLQTAIQQNSGYAEQHQIHLILHDATADAVINVDERRFQQIMSNLLSNAIKFSQPHSTVQIITECQDQQLKIRVIDQGCGIPDNFKEKMFTKFSQADSASNRSKAGTGLGLAICKQLVEQMHGSIGFRSTENVGSEFYLCIPLCFTDTANEQTN